MAQTEPGDLVLLVGSDTKLVLWRVGQSLACDVEQLLDVLPRRAHDVSVAEPCLVCCVDRCKLRAGGGISRSHPSLLASRPRCRRLALIDSRPLFTDSRMMQECLVPILWSERIPYLV